MIFCLKHCDLPCIRRQWYMCQIIGIWYWNSLSLSPSSHFRTYHMIIYFTFRLTPFCFICSISSRDNFWLSLLSHKFLLSFTPSESPIIKNSKLVNNRRVVHKGDSPQMTDNPQSVQTKERLLLQNQTLIKTILNWCSWSKFIERNCGNNIAIDIFTYFSISVGLH